MNCLLTWGMAGGKSDGCMLSYVMLCSGMENAQSREEVQWAMMLREGGEGGEEMQCLTMLRV